MFYDLCVPATFISMLLKLKLVKNIDIPLRASIRNPQLQNGDLTTTHLILVTALPKSGSTYLTRLLSEITRYPSGHLVQFYEHNEQELCEYRLINALHKKLIIHQHVKAGENNLTLMRKYNIKPIILVRNIYDILLSLYDHIEKEDHRTPIGYIHQNYFSFSREEKLNYLIHIHIPWYFNFFVSWLENSNHIDCTWITYEDLFSEKKLDIIEKIMIFQGLSTEYNIIIAAIDKMASKSTRLNIGKSGRGNSLSQQHKDKILELASSWRLPSGSFKLIGIDEV